MLEPINTNSHEKYMRRCISIALKGAGNVAPNPMVGAVLVYQDTIIGEGWHEQYGQAHAEVNCINNVPVHLQQLIPESTLYVSLEPCAHHGKTPPCSDLIIQHKIPHVVVGCVDTFAAVAGRGIQKLRDAGIQTIYPILEDECRQLNKHFFTFHEKKRPFVLLKWAESSDGYLSAFGSRRLMLSNVFSQILVHKLRSEYASILVGYNTVLADNPALDNRHWAGKSPTRIVIDFNNTLPKNIKLFDQQQATIVFNFQVQKTEGNICWIKLEQGNVAQQVLDFLYQQNIQSVLIEGGNKTLQSFIDAGLWDEALCIQCPVTIGCGTVAPALKQAQLLEQKTLQQDHLLFFRNETYHL